MKKAIKYISRTLLVLTIISTFSCEKDEIEVDNTPKVVISNSNLRSKFVRTSYPAGVGQVFSFIDASQGVVSRKWTVDPDSSFGPNVMIVNNPQVLDAEDITDVIPFIISGRTTTSDERLHLVYRTAGTYNITLELTFNEEVSVTKDDSSVITAVPNGDQWVLTIPITIVVL
ncbi:hypothetical protein Q4Q39_02070 [Flavivirga amylovorans]|uniref:PKD domain-containing protein n=1 Tax=Flavivirga amylovorans TaxID=870486 RepID=A0ABT8WWX9_9FLAO|nr:hypothetical protein [Flavivirga amylovorans]MDO5986178.1 hypothetical protein [Flavivirga amylovorans]